MRRACKERMLGACGLEDQEKRGARLKFCLREGTLGLLSLRTSCPAEGALVEQLSPVAPGYQDGASSSPRSSWLGNFLDSLAHFEAGTLSITKM